MAACPACDFEIDVDEFDVERGDELSCSECGANLEVSRVRPVELTLAGDEEEAEEGDEEQDRNDSGVDGTEGEDDDGDWEA